jgi:PAS domain-containing protein
LKNLSFNSNLTNYGYCGSTLDNPDFATSCQNDLDCPQGQVCSAQISKLQRNYQRLRDLKKLQDTLQAYFTANKHYPELSEGTFLKGKILFINQALEKTTGYSTHEAIGKTPAELWGGQMSKEFYTKIWDTIKKQKRVCSGKSSQSKKIG